VLLLLVDELHVARRGRTAPIGRIGVAISKARDDARKRLFDRLPIGGLRRIARKLDRLVHELSRREDSESRRYVGGAKAGWRWAIDARLAKRASRLRAAVDRAGAVYLPERLHEVRIGIKKLRYAVELAGEAAASDRQPELRALKRGQELLGRMHDLQLLIDRVRDEQASLTPANLAVGRDLDTMVEALDEDCRRLHARYMRGRGGLLAVATTLTRGQTPARLRRGLTPTVVPLTTVASARRVS
jgi:CHAD domain-containing protein